MTQQKPRVQDLFDRTGLSQNEFGAKSGVWAGTIGKALKGEYISRLTATRIVNALNKILGTDYTLAEVEGLNYEKGA